MTDNSMRAKRALQALRAVDQKGMGRVAGGMGAEATDRLADLDACTLGYRAWSPSLIPGVLQTPSYAAGAIKGHTPSLEAAEVGRLVSHRRVRAEAFLSRRNALDKTLAWFLIGEDAIRRPLLNSYSHAEQLRQLLAIIQDYGNIVVQVMPADVPVPVTAEAFSVFHLDPGPMVGHLETLIGGWYTVASEDIERLQGAFNSMTARALSMRDSRDFISEELSQCWEHSTAPTSSSPATATPTTASTSPGLPPAPSA